MAETSKTSTEVSRSGCCRSPAIVLSGCPGNIVLFCTSAVYVMYFFMGLSMPLMGTTVVHLERLFDVDTASMAFTFTAISLGVMIGSFICGVVYDRMPAIYRELAFSIAILLLGAFMASATFIGQLGGLAAFIPMATAWTIPRGFFATCSQPYCVNMWEGNRFRNPVLQACHASWSLGATIGPIIFKLFLVELPTSEEPTTTTTLSSSSKDYDHSSDFIAPTTELVTIAANDNTTRIGSSDDDIDVSDVRFAFVTAGSLFLIPATMYLVVFITKCFAMKLQRQPSECPEQPVEGPPSTRGQQQQQQQQADDVTNEVCCEKQTVADKEQRVDSSPADDKQCNTSRSDSEQKVVSSEKNEKQRQTRSKLLLIFFLVLVFLFYHVNMYVEQVMMSYLTSFAIKYLGWPVQQASNVLSLYYLCHFASRVAAIPIATFLKPRTMMACNISITAMACLLLLAVNAWPSMLWVSSALIGYGASSTFSTGILWISSTIRVTGRVSSTFIIGSSSGSMIGPLIVGQLFDNATPMAFVYMLIAAIFCHATLFTIMNFYIRRYGGEFGIRNETAGDEVSIGASDETSDTDNTTYF